jgi:hypothetical protein
MPPTSRCWSVGRPLPRGCPTTWCARSRPLTSAVPDHDGASACSTSAPATVTTNQATASSTAAERGRIRVPGGAFMPLGPTRGRPDLLTEVEPAGRIRFTIAPLLAASLGIGGDFAGADRSDGWISSATVRSAIRPQVPPALGRSTLTR